MRRGRAVAAGSVVVGLVVLGVVVGRLDERPVMSPRVEGDLPSCGTVDLPLGTDPVGVPPDRAACLSGPAADRSGAELTVVRYTDEGHPITYYYRRHPGVSGLEVMEDQTAAPLTAGGWRVSLCPEATGPQALGDCSYLG